MTTAVILPPSETSYLPVAGLPLIQRTALAGLRGGFAAVVALGGGDAGRLRMLFDRDRRTRAIPVVTDEALPALAAGPIALLPSDCLITTDFLAGVSALDGTASVRVLRSSDADRDGAGVWLCPAGAATDWRALVEAPTGTPAPPVIELPQGLCRRVRDPAAARAAEARLVAGLRAETADTDGAIARFDRALSTQLSRRLVHTPLRPNHLTTIGTMIGLLGAWSFAHGGYWPGVLGAVLFWMAVIIDGCDGEVARLKFQETKWGGLYDVVTDNIVHVAVFAGLGVGYFRPPAGAGTGVYIGLLLTGFLCALAATYFCLLRHPPVKYLQPRTRAGRTRQALLRGFEALMNRDFAYLLLVLAAIGHLAWFLWGSAFGAYAYAAGLALIYRWRNAE